MLGSSEAYVATEGIARERAPTTPPQIYGEFVGARSRAMLRCYKPESSSRPFASLMWRGSHSTVNRPGGFST